MHAVSLAAVGATVDLIGYCEHELPAQVRGSERIRIHELASHRSTNGSRLRRLGYVMAGLGRSLRLAWSLMHVLVRLDSPDLLLLQNPPVFPTAVVATLVARFRGAKVVLDWHNTSQSMLGLRLGQRHAMVNLLGVLEGRVASVASGHLCVSRAMARFLRARWGIEAEVLYDRAPVPQPMTDAVGREALLRRVFGIDHGGDCPLILTTTSWTGDEDLEMFLDVANEVDRRLRARSAPRRVCFVATGDGPDRERFERRVAASDLENVTVLTGWLSREDYESILVSADLGVSFHRSSSGVDLPMKIADMRGARLPVAALDYGAVLREILDPGVDGLLFSGPSDLAAIIEALFLCGSRGRSTLEGLRDAAGDRFGATWMDGWMREALPAIKRWVA